MNTETALKLTIEWYTKYFDGKNMREVTEEQIAEFQKL
jgi:ABC-type transporter MlaC component